MIVETTGVLHMHLADCEPAFSCGDGVSVSFHRTVVNPCEDAPLGVENLTVTSPVGWLHYDEIDGVHVFEMGEAPVVETPRSQAMMEYITNG
jgi:hypothetical protein